MIQTTSREAFSDIRPTLGHRQAIVYNLLSTRDNWTNTELSSSLGWPINVLVPRTNELVKMGLVREALKRKCSVTNRNVIAWEVIRETLF